MVTTRQGSFKGSRALLLTLVLATGLVALFAGLRRPFARFLAEHWQNRLRTVPDERAAVLLKGVAQLGEPGIPVLVEALGSERESVASSGKRVLLDEIRGWETLRAREYSPKLAILAKALADRVERFGPTARADAAELAARILRLWTLDDQVVDPTEVIAACEKVLRATSAERRLLANRPLPGQPGDGTTAEEQPAAGTAGAPCAAWSPGTDRAGHQPKVGPEAWSVGPLAQSPPGHPPGDVVSPETDVALQGLADADPGEPRRLGDSSPPQPLPQLPQPLGPHREADGTSRIPERLDAPSHQTRSAEQPSVRPLSFFEEVPAAAGDRPGGRSASGELAGLDTVDLMRRLQAPEDRTVAEAQAELVRRGFTQTRLALARQMFDPDPEVRMRLARLLTELPNVDAVPWLVELSHDADPEVRLSAIGLLATTGDPGLLEAIERIAKEDPDPRVQRQAEGISRQLRALRH